MKDSAYRYSETVLGLADIKTAWTAKTKFRQRKM